MGNALKLSINARKWARRVFNVLGFYILSHAFMDLADQGKLTAEHFVTYPLGSIMFYVPALAEKLLRIYKGVPETAGGNDA